MVSSAAIDHSIRARDVTTLAPTPTENNPATQAADSSPSEARGIPYIVQPGQGGLPPIPLPPGVLLQQPPYPGKIKSQQLVYLCAFILFVSFKVAQLHLVHKDLLIMDLLKLVKKLSPTLTARKHLWTSTSSKF